jgi:hypothetical protein
MMRGGCDIFNYGSNTKPFDSLQSAASQDIHVTIGNSEGAPRFFCLLRDAVLFLSIRHGIT